jgi:E3 ubiquitin-protein ligase BRE1
MCGLQTNLEKQIAEMKTSQQLLITKNREHQTRVAEQNNTIESLKSQVSDLSMRLKSRDADISKESSARREAETECKRLHVKLEDAQRSLDNHKPKGGEDSHLEALRVCFIQTLCRQPKY